MLPPNWTEFVVSSVPVRKRWSSFEFGKTSYNELRCKLKRTQLSILCIGYVDSNSCHCGKLVVQCTLKNVQLIGIYDSSLMQCVTVLGLVHPTINLLTRSEIICIALACSTALTR